MKIEKQTILTADEGMLLTDGKNFVKEIRLPEEADEKVWDEITEEEYNILQKESANDTGGE
jgi:hypothetical protein